ncbi:hypothetical protein VTK73DRAFT_7736 [Phialemonium thermophilum]|uniref:Uncharacterized protein n=1 Tax=Phialemonium thermophilum TaxID=223376 RepID=A0ABR3WDD5_9PEZI
MLSLPCAARAVFLSPGAPPPLSREPLPCWTSYEIIISWNIAKVVGCHRKEGAKGDMVNSTFFECGKRNSSQIRPPPSQTSRALHRPSCDLISKVHASRPPRQGSGNEEERPKTHAVAWPWTEIHQDGGYHDRYHAIRHWALASAPPSRYLSYRPLDGLSLPILSVSSIEKECNNQSNRAPTCTQRSI